MSSSHKANLIVALAKGQRFANCWRSSKRGGIFTKSTTGKFHFLSSQATSSIHYDDDISVSRSEKVPPARSLNGLGRHKSNRKSGIVPLPKEEEASSQSTLQASKQDDISKVDAHDLDRKDPQSVHTSPSELAFTGDSLIPVTSRLHIVTPKEDTPRGIWPIFRIMVSFVNIDCKSVDDIRRSYNWQR